MFVLPIALAALFFALESFPGTKSVSKNTFFWSFFGVFFFFFWDFFSLVSLCFCSLYHCLLWINDSPHPIVCWLNLSFFVLGCTCVVAQTRARTNIGVGQNQAFARNSFVATTQLAIVTMFNEEEEEEDRRGKQTNKQTNETWKRKPLFVFSTHYYYVNLLATIAISSHIRYCIVNCTTACGCLEASKPNSDMFSPHCIASKLFTMGGSYNTAISRKTKRRFDAPDTDRQPTQNDWLATTVQPWTAVWFDSLRQSRKHQTACDSATDVEHLQCKVVRICAMQCNAHAPWQVLPTTRCLSTNCFKSATVVGLGSLGAMPEWALSLLAINDASAPDVAGESGIKLKKICAQEKKSKMVCIACTVERLDARHPVAVSSA